MNTKGTVNLGAWCAVRNSGSQNNPKNEHGFSSIVEEVNIWTNSWNSAKEQTVWLVLPWNILEKLSTMGIREIRLKWKILFSRVGNNQVSSTSFWRSKANKGKENQEFGWGVSDCLSETEWLPCLRNSCTKNCIVSDYMRTHGKW